MRQVHIALMSVLLTLTQGCSAGRHLTEIPVGQWQGRGFFVYEVWPSAEEAETQPAAPTRLYRSYPTRLVIRRLAAGERKAFELDILSERGPLPELGDRTHLKAALIEAGRISPAATLYRLADWKFNPQSDAVLNLNRPEAPLAASCISFDGTMILRIRYDEEFTDTFRFRGSRLEKDGILHADTGLIHWSERLDRRK